MLLPLYVLCSKNAIKKKFILKFPEILRGFPCSLSGHLVENLSCVVCAVFVTSRHTTHYRSKTVKSRIVFVLMCVVSHILRS